MIKDYIIIILAFILITIHISQASITNTDNTETLNRIKERTHKLATKIADFWLAHGPDKENGGIYGFHDIKGVPDKNADKGLIQQARHLWFFSLLRKENFNNPSNLAVLDDICHNIYNFIITKFRDPEDNLFYFSVSANGNQVKSDIKQFYANAFAIYALSQYGMTFPKHSEQSKEYALNCFHAMVTKGFDSDFGGYDQSQDPWYFSAKERQDKVTKDYNTHLHILEAFTALYLFTKDSEVKEKLNSLTDIFLNKMISSRNYIHLRFKGDWTPYGDPIVSYGHDLEAIWLLKEAMDALGRNEEATAIKKLIKVGAHSAKKGFDSDKGGYFEEGVPNGDVIKSRKIWWVQAEALNGLLYLYKWTGKRKYLKRINRTLDWIEQYQLNKETGEWYSDLNSDGTPQPNALKTTGNLWKTAYHAGRACVYFQNWIHE